jgi:uncharacterized membrane protein YGL010W
VVLYYQFMARIDKLLNEYGESHLNATNKAIHWVCVPAIVLSLIGLIWSIPIPDAFSSITAGKLPLNWATLFIAFALIYYVRLSIPLAIGMLVFIGILLSLGYLIAVNIPLPLWTSCLIIFSVAWVGQFWGHKIEGKKPSFLKDVQFLLIGPVWLLSFIYKRVGIKYS